MKIVELQIDDSSLSGFDATALVENPAIEQDFIAFNKVKMAEMTHNDYPESAVSAAKRGIELNKENNMKCATQVGKVRAQQLVNGEKLSLDTIQRMRSFLIRQKGNYELATKRKDYTACGYISYLLWGGEAALPWAEKKLRQAGMEFGAYSLYNNISFDYDGVLTTAAGKELARQEIAKGNHVYIISARDNKESMLDVANEIGIPDQNVFASKTNSQKVNYIQTLNIDKHYDDNADVVNQLLGIGHKFGTYNNEGLLESYAGLDDACESGYKAIGLKTKNGRKVPNCVPESNFEEELFNEIIADMLFEEGVPHYTADGKLYEGPTHKQGDRLMTGDVHTDESEFLYHEGEFEINVAALPNFINEASSGSKHKYFDEEVLPSILTLKKNKFASQLADKQMLVGPLMTPNKLIPRVDEVTGEEYEVFFSADTIEKIAYKMMADKLLDKVNIEHDSTQPVNDVHLVETWIVKDPEHDKSSLYGFKPVQGQWFGIYRIGDGRMWNEYVKTGKVKGFSVEGYFYNNILTNK